MMGKVFMIIFATLTITGCERIITNSGLDQMKSNCKHNSGVKYVITYNNPELYSVQCNDGAIFKHKELKND